MTNLFFSGVFARIWPLTSMAINFVDLCLLLVVTYYYGPSFIQGLRKDTTEFF
jgi:hypothetical protein